MRMEIFDNVRFGFCGWDIPALMLLVGSIVFSVLRRRQLNDRRRELEYELAGKYVDDIIGFDE